MAIRIDNRMNLKPRNLQYTVQDNEVSKEKLVADPLVLKF